MILGVMYYSKLFGKTSKTAPAEADSANARLLIQGGFVDQLAAGIYTYLPLGLRVLNKIKNIVREEMEAIGGQEILMPALLPSEPWEKTGRWSDPGPEVMFQFEGRGGKKFGLGWTHEEIVAPLVQKFVHSYKDLPLAVYQIQDKFRNEPRAKSGLLRGREFSMKDLYSFHLTLEDLEAYYEKVMDAYLRIYRRCGLEAVVTEASGGAFSKYSHEFQVVTENGEDTIMVCDRCRYAQNREIAEFKAGDKCPKCGGVMKEEKAIEVGNIFKLGTRFTEAIGFSVTGGDGQPMKVIEGCYGIGPSRMVGSIVEVYHDEAGIIWPKSVAPYLVHLISLGSKDVAAARQINESASTLYEKLIDSGLEVLWDDRLDVSAGEKFADADLIGLPLRLVVSEKTLKENSVEWKERVAEKVSLIPLAEVVEAIKNF
jgi:prolyl-tRNA synthetase